MKNKITQSIIASSLLAVAAFAAPSKPSINITSTPLGGSLYGNQAITYEIVDANNSLTYYHSCDKNGTSTPYPGGNTNTNYSCTPTSSGNWYINVQAVDPEGVPSLAYNSTPISVDVDNPVLTINKTTNTNGTVSITMESTDASSTPRNIYFTTNGSTPTESSTQYDGQLTFAVGAIVKALAVDDAANSSDIGTEVFALSLTPTIQTTSDTTNLNGRTFPTTTSAGADASDIRTSVTISGTGFTKYKYKIDSDNWSGENNISVPIPITGLTSASHNLYVQMGDAYNWEDVPTDPTVTFTVDNTAPTALSIKYNNDATVTTVNPTNVTGTTEVTISATDASSYGYEVTSASTDCPSAFSSYTSYSSGFNLGTESTLSDSQEVKVCMAAKDASGNLAKTSKTYTIDKTAPLITMPDAQSYAGSITEYLASTSATDTIKYSIADAVNGACSTTGKTYETLANTYSENIAISGTASKCLYAASSDEVGNASDVNATLFTYSVSAATLDIDLVDNVTFATTNTHGATPYTDINVTGLNLAIYTYEFDENGTVTQNTFNDSADNLINVELSEGDHNITIVGYSDSNSTNSTKTKLFTIDNTAPSEFDASDYNDTNFTTTSYNLTLNKPSDADYMMYSEDNTTYTTTASTSVNLSFTSTTTLYTKTKDEAGNMSAVYSATFTQDIPVRTYTLSSGWNLTTLPSDDISNIGLSGAYIWDYNGTAWGNNIPGDSYIDFTSTDSSKGYWVYTATSKEIQIDGDDTSSVTISSAPQGWSLLGTTSEITDTSDANITWTYASGIWRYATTNSDLNTTLDTLGYGAIDSIEAFSGYWIYKE